MAEPADMDVNAGGGDQVDARAYDKAQVDCRAALNNLQDYLKREITPELAVEIRQHLERCRPCLNHARFEENFLRMLADRAGCITCPDMLRARIMAALRATTDDH